MDQLQARWWRFDRYEIRSFTGMRADLSNRIGPRIVQYIAAAPGARLISYDPVDARQSRLDNDARPIYLRLFDLVEGLNLHPTVDGCFSLAPDSVEHLLAWCNEYGLLGILPHRAQQVALAPRWVRVRDVYLPSGDDPRLEEWAFFPTMDNTVPAQSYFIKSADGWTHLERGNIHLDHSIQGGGIHDLSVEGQVADPVEWPSYFVEAHAVLSGDDRSAASVERLSESWGRFFPTVIDTELQTYPYPQPLSDSFWRLYAEPVDEFVNIVADLRYAVDAASQPASADGLSGVGLDAPNSFNALHSIIREARPRLEFDRNGTVRMGWSVGSLLAALALMAAEDLVGPRRLRSCSRCGKLYASSRYQSSYCSTTCRSTIQKRRQRGRKQDRHA